MTSSVYLGLGSNMGDRMEALRNAVRYISRIRGTVVEAVSGVYETNPVGYTEQDKFLNAAVRIKTSLEPLCLLEELQKIEASLKRTRTIRWGPRTIDIDILLFGEQSIRLPELTVPHPRMLDRAFALVPLKDIMECGEINGKSIDLLIRRCADREGVKLYAASLEEGMRLL